MEAKRLYCNHFIDISKNKRKTKWNIIRNETGKVHSSDHMPPSFKTGNTEVLPYKAGGAFNSHFLNITESLNVQNVKESSSISYLRNSQPSRFPSMNIGNRSIINSLKSKCSSGYEERSCTFLKLYGTQISKLLSYMCNKLISIDISPEFLK